MSTGETAGHQRQEPGEGKTVTYSKAQVRRGIFRQWVFSYNILDGRGRFMDSRHFHFSNWNDAFSAALMHVNWQAQMSAIIKRGV